MKENPSVTAIKSWVFPALLTVLAAIIWHDVNEIKSDVKALMAQSNIDKTRIDNLERIIYQNDPLKTFYPDPQRSVAILPNNNFEFKKKENEKVL
jgi:hypothetical protein